VTARLRAEHGFGLVELLIAMLIMNVALLTILGAFTAGATAVRQASRVSTAATLADAQMELYRALTYSAIALDPSTIPTTTPYTSDTSYSATQITATCSGAVSTHNECNASRTLTGPDHGSYEIDTYIVTYNSSNGGPTNGRDGKLVTVVVRDASNLTATPFAREQTSFDASTGQ